MPTPIIEIEGLGKRYAADKPPAVDNVSYTIHEGEIFSLLGPNGAGKSTTIAMLCGLVTPSAGDARIAGHSIRGNLLAAKRLIGIVPQEIALYGSLSARQNLRFWGQMYDMGGKALDARIDEVLEQIGLSERGNDRIDTYSGGMKRRVNIGAGLLHKPKVLFMDEPTVGIDPQSRRAILDMTKQLNAAGMTVLYTTHYMEEAQELSDRIGIQDHGKLIALGTLAELTQLVGQTEALHLHVSDPTSALLTAIKALPGVNQVLAQENVLTVLTDDATGRLPTLVATVAQSGVRLTNLELRQPNLEALFLHLTGKALRD